MFNNKLKNIDINKIQANENQPRTVFNEEKIEELAASIKENGLIQPIVVRKVNGIYQIIAGERRYRACCSLNMKQVPCIIEDYDDKSLILHRITTIDIVPKDFRLFTAEQREKYIQSLVAELYTQKENWHFINTKFGLDTDNEEGMADYMAFRKIIDERKRVYGMISEAFYVTDERGFCHYIGEVAEKEEEYDEDEDEGWED